MLTVSAIIAASFVVIAGGSLLLAYCLLRIGAQDDREYELEMMRRWREERERLSLARVARTDDPEARL